MSNRNTLLMLEELLSQARSRGAEELLFASAACPLFVISGQIFAALGASLSADTVRSLHHDCLAKSEHSSFSSSNLQKYRAAFPLVGPIFCQFKVHANIVSLQIRLDEPAAIEAEPKSSKNAPAGSAEAAPNPAVERTGR